MLGAGAYGYVYRTWDATLAREVALKIIRTERSDPMTAAAVLREGQMLARVRHPNIVTIFGAQQIGREFGFWMELIHGRPLTQMIREGGPLGADEAMLIGITLCDALAAVHGAGLLHRDVKAQNVMRESGGRIVLMDFGAGRELTTAAGSSRPEIAGTPVYMSPHVLAGEPWTARADLYSVGVLLFYLVTGRYPIEGRTVSDIALGHALGQQRMLPDLRPGLPEAFVRVVQRALESRYQTPGAMMKDLGDAARAGGRFVVEGRESSGGTDRAHDPRSDAAWNLPQRLEGDRSWRGPMLAGAAVLGVWMLGFMTSQAFDQTLGRLGGFSDESPLDWLILGIQSLIGPIGFAAAATLVYQIARLIGRFSARLILRNRWPAGGPLTMFARWRARVGLTGRNTRAQWLVGLQVVALAVVCWSFADFIWAFTSLLDTAPPEALRQLNPANNLQLLYRMVLSIVALVSAAGWFGLIRERDDAPIDRVTATVGFSLIAVTLVLLSVPYRLVHQSEFRRVQFDGQRCYITGQRGGERLVFCPGTSPRNHVVGENDPRLVATSTIENIFSHASPDAPR
jgi:serine/threonine-protein kinase